MDTPIYSVIVTVCVCRCSMSGCECMHVCSLFCICTHQLYLTVLSQEFSKHKNILAGIIQC